MLTLGNADVDTQHCWQGSEMVWMYFCLQGLMIRLGTFVKVPEDSLETPLNRQPPVPHSLGSIHHYPLSLSISPSFPLSEP